MDININKFIINKFVVIETESIRFNILGFKKRHSRT